MSKDTTTDRAALARAASLVRPALADKAYVPALTHVAFDGKWATAYDEKLAISVRCEAPIERLVPGVLLVQGLGSFGGKEILIQQDGDSSIVLKSGRSKVKLPTLPADAFPFSWPKSEGAELTAAPDVLKGIERCLVSVNTDGAHPAQLGVTIDADDSGRAVLYSTDNASVSRAQCDTKVKLPGGVPVILPKAFCEQLVGLAKAFPEAAPAVLLGDGFVEAEFEEDKRVVARVFHRIPVDVDPMDFGRIVQKHCGDLGALKKRLAVIPDEFDAALSRALLVLGGEVKKRATVRVDDGTLKLRATSDMGDSDDSMKYDADDVGPVTMDAALVARGLKGASTMCVTDAVTVLTTDDKPTFLHMVAHIRDLK